MTIIQTSSLICWVFRERERCREWKGDTGSAYNERDRKKERERESERERERERERDWGLENHKRI